MLQLYGSVNSRAMRNIWMLNELGVSYGHKDWLPRAPETKTPEFRALNANSRVPTIDDDGFILSESMAINIYLAKKHKSPLYPADAKTEALVLQWSLWETDRLDRQVVDYQRHSSQLPAAERKPEVAEKAWNECVPAFDVLEDALKNLQTAKQLAGQGKLDGAEAKGANGMADFEKLFREKMAGLGQSDGEGQDSGNGPGIGNGAKRPEDETTKTGFKTEKDISPITGGKMLLEWKTKEVGDTGARAAEYRDHVQRVKQGVSEAIQQEQVPPGYHEAIKKYFDTLPEKPAK